MKNKKGIVYIFSSPDYKQEIEYHLDEWKNKEDIYKDVVYDKFTELEKCFKTKTIKGTLSYVNHFHIKKRQEQGYLIFDNRTLGKQKK